MNRKRALRWAFTGVSAVIVAIALFIVYGLYVTPLSFLLVYASPEYAAPAPMRWAAKQFVYAFHPTKEEVEELNVTAGARLAIQMTDNHADAERLLNLFISHGVNINGTDEGLSSDSKHLTALHGVALTCDVFGTRLLLSHGARADQKDLKGRTPLDLVKMVQSRNPNKQECLQTVTLLAEAAQSAPH